MSISADQARQFREHGWVAAPGFFDAQEVRALQAEVARFQRDGLVRNVATDGDGKTHSTTKANLQLLPLHDKGDLLRALPFEARVQEAITRLIGDPYVLHLDQMFLKPARHGAGTSWHQDNAYFKIADPLKGTAMWIAVHDATVANGTLHVIPDSFRVAYEHTRDPGSDHHILCYPEEKRAVPVELGAGGVAFFCYGTAHCTLGNETDRDRAGVAFHFLRTDAIVDDRFQRIHLTGPEATGGEREFGRAVAGTWGDEVRRLLGER